MKPFTPVALHPFDWAHAPEMTDLWIESWQEAMPEIDFEARRGWFVDRTSELLEAGSVFDLAFSTFNGALVGFVTVDPGTGYVDQLVVHPDHWGNGVAEVLIGAAAARAPGRIELDVNEENRRAVHFYEKTGFRVIAGGVNASSGRPTLKMEWRPDGRAPSSSEGG